MSDIATLGLVVDSSQVKTATGDLQKFNTEAQKTEQRSGAIAAAAKREKVSYEEMAARYKAAGAGAKGLNQELGKTPPALNAGATAAKAASAAKKELNEEVGQLRAGLRTLSREAFLLPGPLGAVSRVLGGMSYGMTPLTLGITAGVVGFAAISAVVSAAVIKFAEFEAHQARVTNAINATNGASRQSAASIEAFVQAQAASGTQSTGIIREAAAGLLRYRDVAGNSFGEVLKASQDLAATGFTDLKGASEALGKSFRNPTDAMKELEAVGIKLSDTQQRQINEFYGAGRAADAYRIILDAVKKVTEGADEKLADTLSGAWGRASNAIQSYLEHLGEAIARQLKLKEILDATSAGTKFIEKNGFPAFFGIPRGGMAPANDNSLANQAGLRDIGASNKLGAAAGLGDLGDDTASKVATAAELTAQRLARANAEAEKLREAWGGISIEQARILQGLTDQLSIAQAVTGIEKINAQYAVDYAQAIRDGATASEAALEADLRRSIALAQVESQAKNALLAMKDQEAVARAVTGVQQMQAQEQATFNNLVRQGVSEETALATAAQQTANAKAAANAEADRLVTNLQNQAQLIRAASEEERDRIRAAQEYNRLIKQGVDTQKAGAIAAQMQANSRSERDAREMAQAEQDAARAAQDHARANERAAAAAQAVENAAIAAQAAWDAAAAALKFIPFYLQDAMAAARGTDLMAGLFDSKQGGKSQFNPDGYKFSEQTATGMFGENVFGSGGYSIQGENWDFPGRAVPNAQGLEKFVNDALMRDGGDVSGAIDKLIDTQGTFLKDKDTSVIQATAQTLARLTNLLPDDASKMQAIWRQIQTLNEVPQPGIVQRELIAGLTQQLKDLQEATNKNTDALNAQLDPLFSQGHDYIDKLRIGFFENADGGIMSKFGRMPLQHFADGGITTAPTMFTTSENYHPEAIIPLKNGNVPVKITGDTGKAENNYHYYGPESVVVVDGQKRRSRLTPGQRRAGFVEAA